MKRLYFTIFIFLLYPNIAKTQSRELHCVETSIKSDNDANDPILIKTCYYKYFKFVTISNPDAVGRYFPENEEHEIFVQIHGRYIETKNSSLFNNKENELLVTINNKIHQEYLKNSTSDKSKDCFMDADSIRKWYKMDDLEISFEGNKIWFRVSFGLPAICRYVDGVIVEFRFGDIVKYLE
jgi:hypothetical protein